MPKFDKPDEDSPFLSFVRKEFHQGRGTDLRKELADKTTVHEHLRDLSIRAPGRIAELSDIDHFSSLDLPERFVLKYAHGWSSRGVMLIQRMAPESYFCFLSQQLMSAKEIVERQNKTASSFSGPDSWIIEEMVESTIAGKPIPLDYKFQCFRGRIGLVVQIDRNVYPPKVAIMDENFAPLTHKVDYVLRSKNAQIGVPVVPLHADALYSWAKFLSCYTDSPFVGVDLYDSPSGPYFGEFTFSPGGTHRRMWVYSHGFLEELDRIFLEGQTELLQGKTNEGASPGARETAFTSPELYSHLAGAVLDGSLRAASRLEALCRSSEGRAAGWPDLELAWKKIGELIFRRQTYSLNDRLGYISRHS